LFAILNQSKKTHIAAIVSRTWAARQAKILSGLLYRVCVDLTFVRRRDRPQQSVRQANLQAMRGYLRLVRETMKRA
jgi:hypothetical protein